MKTIDLNFKNLKVVDKCLLVWSLGRIKRNYDLFGRCLEDLESLIEFLDVKYLAFILWSMGRLEVKNISLMKKISDHF